MNAILAVICFVIVFQGPGKERRASVVSVVDSGSPSFTWGIPPGAVIGQIGEVENPTFKDLTVAVISHYNSELKVVFHRPGDKEKTTITMIPRKDSNDDRPLMGISPSFVPVLEEKRFVGSDLETPTMPNSAASRANPPFAFGDEIIATTDPADPDGKPLPLRKDPRKAEGDQYDYFDLTRQDAAATAGRNMVFVVKRESQGEPINITVTLRIPQYHRRGDGDGGNHGHPQGFTSRMSPVLREAPPGRRWQDDAERAITSNGSKCRSRTRTRR